MLLHVHVHFIYLFRDCHGIHGIVDFVRLLYQELCRLHLLEMKMSLPLNLIVREFEMDY